MTRVAVALLVVALTGCAAQDPPDPPGGPVFREPPPGYYEPATHPPIIGEPTP